MAGERGWGLYWICHVRHSVTLWDENFRRTFLRNCAHLDSGWMYRVYRNQAAVAYSSLFLFFLSLQFSKIKNFRYPFLRECETYKVETWYSLGTHVTNGWVYRVTRIRFLLHIRPFIFFIFFFPILYHLKFSSPFFEIWNLVHMVTMGWCIVYTGIRLLLLIHPLLLHFSFQFSMIENFRHTFLRNCELYKLETWCTWWQWMYRV